MKWTPLFCASLLTILACFSAQAEIKVLALAGSTREGSYNKALVKEAAQVAQQMGARVKIIDLQDYPLPFYDGDFEASQGMPIKAQELRKLMESSQVILIASPEYNASVSGVLKNTLDWVSRRLNGVFSQEAFKEKKFVLLSASTGRGGGARGLIHLKTILEYIGGHVYPKTFSLPAAYQAFDEQGHLRDPQQKAALKEILQQAMQPFPS